MYINTYTYMCYTVYMYMHVYRLEVLNNDDCLHNQICHFIVDVHVQLYIVPVYLPYASYSPK